jgi:exosortase/archaeosortase family protein
LISGFQRFNLFAMSGFQRFRISAFLFLPLAWLWFVLINDLRVEWTVNPQYGYGWAVPFLCAYLFWKNAETLKTENLKSDKQSLDVSASQRVSLSDFEKVSAFQLSAFVLLAFLYAPTRLIQAANPGWRLISWALALEVVGITLCVLRLVEGRGRRANAETLKTEILKSSIGNQSRFSFSAFQLSAFVFPICFFLVAVPWPSGLETAVIQGLTRLDAAGTCELMGWLGIPAIPHGNVIEVATGQVGIDEACSGIRSFQATLMISLFLGELYRLSVIRRSVLCLSGFAMSFGFNLVRMSILVWVAASRGVDSIAKWHDPTGVTILLACFLGLWALGVVLGKGKKKLKC